MNPLLKVYNGKRFFWSGDYLKPHMRIHAGYKPYYVCEVCGGECFARAANLKTQKRTQTPSTGLQHSSSLEEGAGKQGLECEVDPHWS